MIEGIRLRLRKIHIKRYAQKHNSDIADENFTIISNNCWGGQVYESYGLQKRTPTVGLFMFSEDYLTFCAHLEECLSTSLEFIDPYDSKWKSMPELKDDRYGQYPVGKLVLTNGDNIEIFFLHYKSREEALEKWTRRCKRVNLNRLIFKFNDQNGFTPENLKTFSELPYSNKLFFTIGDYSDIAGVRAFRVFQIYNRQCITASHEPVCNNRYLDIARFINSV